jgi:hypothetical protein
MIAVAVAALPIFFTGYTIAQWEGVVFLAYYAAYTVSLVLSCLCSCFVYCARRRYLHRERQAFIGRCIKLAWLSTVRPFACRLTRL